MTNHPNRSAALITSRTPIADLLHIDPPAVKSHIGLRHRATGQLVQALIYYPRSDAARTYEGAYAMSGGSNPCFTPLRGDARAAFEVRFRVRLDDVTAEVCPLEISHASPIEREWNRR